VVTHDVGRPATAAVADLVAIVERAAMDLALGEEPSGFACALEDGAADE
jgi:hypothetical protein